MDFGQLAEYTKNILNLQYLFSDFRAVLMVSIPVSILHYWFSRHIKHWVLVDLGVHKWLIK
jgi:hypothetical protein